MPRVIYSEGNTPEMRPGQSSGSTELPALSKVTRFSRQSRETAKGTSQPNDHVLRSLQSSAPFAQSAKQRKGHVFPSTRSFSASRPQGRKRRESGGVTGVSLRNIPQDAKRLRSAKRDAEPLCMSEDVPERNPRHAPGSPVGVLDLVGLSTYRRPADQRWQQR